MWQDIFTTIVQLVVAPARAWKQLDKENIRRGDFLNRFLHPVFGVVAVSAFVGGLWIAKDGSLEAALKNTMVKMITVYGGYFLAAYALNETAPRFGLPKNMYRFQQFAAFSSVVMYALHAVMPFVPGFFILWLLALYTVQIVFVGSVFFLKVDDEKRVVFSITASSVIILMPVLIDSLFSFLIK